MKRCTCGLEFTIDEFLRLEPAAGGPTWYGLAMRNCPGCGSTLALVNPDGVCFDCGALTEEGDCPDCD
jgi:hypothetical protein